MYGVSILLRDLYAEDIIMTSFLMAIFDALARCSPLYINNGAISCTNGNEIGSTCTYECEPGYDLVGDGITKCTEQRIGATWNQQAPECKGRTRGIKWDEIRFIYAAKLGRGRPTMDLNLTCILS